MNSTPQLIVQTATEIRSIQLLEHTEWTIGRDHTNLIQILDRYASRFHAVLGMFENRHVYFRDLNSRNGSFMDGEPIVEPVLMKHGDRITIGNTALVLKHNYVTTSHTSLAISPKQVLMMHASAIEGKIWQEIVLSQTIDVLWEVPGANLRQLIALQTTANLLPSLLILDIQAIQEDIDGLPRWCHLQGLSVQILLIDSARSNVSEAEQAYFKTLGFLNLLPAFPAGQLSTISSDIMRSMHDVLAVFQPQVLNQEALFSSLRKLDQLLSHASILGAAKQAELDAINAEDLTSLKVDPRKLRRDEKH